MAWSASSVERKIRKSTQRKGPRRESYLEAVAGGRTTSTGARKKSSLRKKPAAPTATERRLDQLKAKEDRRQDLADGLTVRQHRAYRNLERATGSAPRRGRTMDELRAGSSYQTQAWAVSNPTAARELRGRRRDLSTIPNAQVNLSDYSTRATLKRREAGAGSPGLAGVGRVVGHTLGGIASATYHEPIGQLTKAAGTIAEAGKALPQVVGLAGALSTVPITKGIEAVVGRQITDMDEKAVQAGSDMVTGTYESYKAKYGPSWRGEKGAAKQLRKQIREEGVLPSVLDAATIVAPASAGLGYTARAGALGAGARTVATRGTKIRYGVNDVVDKDQRRGAIGIAVREGHNAARRGAQKRAIKRADAGKLHGRLGDRREGLPAHRQALQAGEVAPVTNARAARRQRFKTAEASNRRDIRIKQLLNKYVGGEGGILRAQRLVEDPELRPLISVVRQNGIRSSADVPKIIPERLAQIDAEREAARQVLERRAVSHDSDTRTPDDIAATDADLLEHVDSLVSERAMLIALRDDPSLADTPGLAEAADRTAAVLDEAVGAREGLSSARKAAGRTQRQGATVGVKTADELNADAAAKHKHDLDVARTKEAAAHKQRDDVKQRVRTDLSKARERVRVAKGRADVPGKGQARRQATLAAARTELARVQRDASTELAEVSDVARARTEARKEVAAATPRKLEETPEQHAARVDAEFEARGLAKPGYAPGQYKLKDKEMIVTPASGAARVQSNPLRHKNEGTTHRLGLQGFDQQREKDRLVAAIKRGANLEAEANILQAQGRFFNTRAEGEAWIRGLGGGRGTATTDDAKGGWELVQPTLTRKDTEGLIMPKITPGSDKDRGDYIAEHGGVFAVSTTTMQEMKALGAKPTAPATIARRLAHAPQTMLLSLSISWATFQRVNDLVGMAFGGSLYNARELARIRKELRADDPDAADLVEMYSGGSASRTQLNPYSGQTLGRAQRMMDENPRLRDAWNSDEPAYNLLGLSPRLVNSALWLGKTAPTALLRADAKITGAAREMQYIHNLRRFAEKADPDVRAVRAAVAPMGHALKTADTELMHKLLTDPKYDKIREDAAEALNRVMGDWHTFTAAERSVKDFAAFYGFLRYSTRMLMYTLPVDHPMLALTVSQLGSYSAEYAKSIIGEDVPYGLGALYTAGGKVITDLTRANPLTGPLLSLDKPEKIVNLGTPLIAIMASAVSGHNVGLSDSTQGYLKKLTTNGDPGDSSLTMADRTQYVADRVMSLLSPYKMAEGMDTRAQSDDSLLFDKKVLSAPGQPETQARLNQKNARAGKGGWNSVLADAFPIFFSDGRNWKDIGERTTAGVQQRAADERLRLAKKRQAAGDPLAEVEVMKAEQDLEMEELMAPVREAQQEIDELLLDAGIKPKARR